MYKEYRDENNNLTSTIIRLSDNACIPKEPTNIDYQEYLDWVAASNTPEPDDMAASNTPEPADSIPNQ